MPIRTFPVLRPELYAQTVAGIIAAADRSQSILDVTQEVGRISAACGIATLIVERDITQAAAAVGVAMQFGPPTPEVSPVGRGGLPWGRALDYGERRT